MMGVTRRNFRFTRHNISNVRLHDSSGPNTSYIYLRGGRVMTKKEKISYTAPLTGVEEFSNELNADSVHDALQSTWDTKQIHCEQEEDKQ